MSLRPLFHILLTAFIASVMTVSSRAAQSPVERMSGLMMELKQNPENVSALIESAGVYYDLIDYDGCRNMARRLTEIAERHPDSLRAAFYGEYLSGFADMQAGRNSLGAEPLSKALQIARSNDMRLEEAKALSALGYLYSNLETNMSQGMECYNQALDIAHSLGNTGLVVSILNNIADAHLWQREYSGSNYAEEALRLAENIRDERGILISTLNLAHFRCFVGRSEGTVPQMLEKALRMQQHSGYVPRGEIDLIKACLLLRQNRNDEAIRLLKDTLDGGSAMIPPLLRLKLMMYLNWALIRQEHYKEAIKVGQDAHAIASASGFGAFNIPLFSGISYCYERLGDYSSALDYLKKYQWHMDSVWIVEKSGTLNSLRIDNEVRLNRSTLSRQQAELATGHRHISLLIIIGVILLTALTALWYLYRSKNELVRATVAREQETIVRERLLRQQLEQLKERHQAIPSESKSASPGGSIADDKADELMGRFNALMGERRVYTDPSVSVVSVAEMLGTNRTYLSQAINRTFGKSFPQVLADYRIKAAVELLNDYPDDVPLKRIATEAGFTSQSVFFTTFRSVMGMTPTEYRKGRSSDS